MYVSVIKGKLVKLLTISLNFLVAGKCVSTDVHVLPICFTNITSHVPDPGVFVINQTKACCCVPNSIYLHTPVMAREQIFSQQIFFADPRVGGSIVKDGRESSPLSAIWQGVRH